MPVSSHKNSYDLPKKGDLVKVLDKDKIMDMVGEITFCCECRGWDHNNNGIHIFISESMVERCCGNTYQVIESDDNDDTVIISEGYWFPMGMLKIVENGDI